MGNYLFLVILTTFVLLPTCVVGDDRNAGIENQSCGTVTTTFGQKIILKEDVTLTPTEFEKVKDMKLKGAIFSPLTANNCVIKICGFTSFTSSPPKYRNTSLIGSMSDYADCEIISKPDTLASSTIYNNLYNTSSISCGCSKGIGDCVLTCFEREIEWKENECAFLFQESFCETCNFNGIPIQKDGIFTTDNTHHIRSAIVRENCSLQQDITGLNRIWRFENVTRMFQYSPTPTESNVKSAFLADPEIFRCSCNVHPPPPPVTPNDKIYIILTYGFAAAFFIAFCVILFLALFVFRSWRNGLATCEDPTASRQGRSSFDFDYSTLEDSPSDLKFSLSRSQLQLLRQGRFGKVNKWHLNVAIKTVNADTEQLGFESLRQEIKILCHLGIHKNIVRIYGYNAELNGELYLIMENCLNKSLDSFLKNKIQPYLNERRNQKIREMQRLLPMNLLDADDDNDDDSDASNVKEEPLVKAFELEEQVPLELDSTTLRQFFQWAEEIANGMRYITYKKVIHVDLAAKKILLDDKLTAKIGGFGLSRKIYLKEYEETKKESLPIRWMAPEFLMQRKYSPKSDVWPYGILIWEIFTLGKRPYGDYFGELIEALKKGKRLERPELSPEDVYKKLYKCWNWNPEKRPSFNHLYEFFRARKSSVSIETAATYCNTQDAGPEDSHVVYADMQEANESS